MFPSTLALVDDDREYTEFLSRALRGAGIAVDVFADSNDLVASFDPYSYDFYVVDLMLPGIDGINLIKVIRRRSTAGVLVVSGKHADDVFTEVISAGADMYIAKPVQFDQVLATVEAVQRRVGATRAATVGWVLDRRARQLVAPDGVRIELSDSDRVLLECFLEADGKVVARETLRQRLGKSGDEDAAGALNATIYRLRRRIERVTPALVPLQTKAGVGYVFSARLTLA